MKENTLILLLPKGSEGDHDTTGWLAELGLKAWKANDLQHVFEELSDFTVANRPDVILLEVPALARCFNDMQMSIREFSGSTPVTVAAYCDSENDFDSKFFTGDLNKLRSLISEQMPRFPRPV